MNTIDELMGAIDVAYNNFYAAAIKLHEDEKLKNIVEKHVPTGIQLARKENPYISQDEERFPDVPVATDYVLYFGKEGFMLGEKWEGDFFFHESRSPYIIENGRLIWKNKERGTWPLLDAFPQLTYETIEQKVSAHLKRIKKELEIER